MEIGPRYAAPTTALSLSGKVADRLKWVAIPPLRDVEAARAEIHWAKEHGAVGVFFRGMEGNLTLDNPYFSPVYALAEKLDLPIRTSSSASGTAI